MTDLDIAINNISPLSEETRGEFLRAWSSWSVPRDHFMVSENAVCDHIYFVKKGILRIFYFKNGKEITEWIAMDGTFCLSILSFFERTPSRLQIQTLEASEIMGIHYDDLTGMAARFHEVETLFRKMMTASLILSQYRMDSIQFETAQQRYDRLLETQPELLRRVPLTYIASFLGITPETLSRIRAHR